MPLPAIAAVVGKIGAVAGKAAVVAAKAGVKATAVATKGVAKASIKGAKVAGKTSVKGAKTAGKKSTKISSRTLKSQLKKGLSGLDKKRKQTRAFTEKLIEERDRRKEERENEKKNKLKPSKSPVAKKGGDIFSKMMGVAAALVGALIIKELPRIIEVVKNIIGKVKPFFITVGNAIGKVVNFLTGFSPESDGYEEQKAAADGEILNAQGSADKITENDKVLQKEKTSIDDQSKSLRDQTSKLESSSSDDTVGKTSSESEDQATINKDAKDDNENKENKDDSSVDKTVKNKKVDSKKVFDSSHFGTEGYRMGQVMPEQYIYGKDTYTSTYMEKDGKVIKNEETLTELMGSIATEDLLKHQKQLMGEINKVKGYENANIIDVIERVEDKGRLVSMPDEVLYPILNNSDAYKATEAKIDAARKIDKKAGTLYLDPRETMKIIDFNTKKRNLEALNNTDNLTSINGNGKTIIIKQRQIVEKVVPVSTP